MTRSELADAVCEHVWEHHGVQAPVDRKYIARLEEGRIRWPNVRYREALRAVLGVRRDQDLGFVSSNAVQAAKALPPLDQRHVVAGAAAFGGLDKMAPNASVAALSDAFEVALSDEHVSVEEWLERLRQYGQDYMTVGAVNLQARLAGELVRLQSQVAKEPRLLRVTARLLTVNGKTLPSVSDPAGALHWYRLGVRAADLSEDPETQVWVRGRAALALAYEGAAVPMARSLAEQALMLADQPSLGRLNALLAMAHVAGLQGDRDGALLTWGVARRLFDQVGSEEQISDFAIPAWRMGVISSMLLARLGEERLATEAQELARAEMPTTLVRFRTHLEMHQGLMLVRSGNVAEGVLHAQQALEALAPERHSLSLRLMMDEIERSTRTA